MEKGVHFKQDQRGVDWRSEGVGGPINSEEAATGRRVFLIALHA